MTGYVPMRYFRFYGVPPTCGDFLEIGLKQSPDLCILGALAVYQLHCCGVAGTRSVIILQRLCMRASHVFVPTVTFKPLKLES